MVVVFIWAVFSWRVGKVGFQASGVPFYWMVVFQLAYGYCLLGRYYKEWKLQLFMMLQQTCSKNSAIFRDKKQIIGHLQLRNR